MNSLHKYFYISLKFIYIVYLLAAVSNVSKEILLFTISSPLLIALSSSIFAFVKKNDSKGRILLIILTIIYTIVVVLFLLVNKYIIYINFPIIIIETILIKKLNLNNDQATTKATILSIPLQLLFLCIGFSMYNTFLTSYIYIIFVVIMCAFSLWLSLSEMRLLQSDFASGHIFKKIATYVCIIAWIIPFLYSYVLLNNSLNVRLDFMIYGLLIAIYPYSAMLIATNLKTN